MSTLENIAKKAIQVHANDMKIMWVSNYRCPNTKILNWIPVIGLPLDRMLIMWQITMENFVIDMTSWSMGYMTRGP